MRIYIAAPYAVRDELRVFAQALNEDGHIVTSTWLDATHEIHAGTLETAPDLDDDYAEQHSRQDVDEVAASDLVVLVTWGTAQALAMGRDLGGNSGGRHVETGVALALDIPVLVWGEPENIFHRGICAVAADWDTVIDQINVLRDARFGITTP